MNTLITSKKIAIIGGGPGGLTLARLLQINGADVTVYERDTDRSVRVQGATLDLHHDSGLLALEKAGLMTAFRNAYRPGADKLVIVDQKANILLQEHGHESQGPERPEIDRGPLRDLLLDSLLPGTVVWDRQFTTLTPIDNHIELHFSNGRTATADIVIGADGANSRIRPYITKIKPIYSGVSVIEGAVYQSDLIDPYTHQLINGGKICALGDSKSLFVGLKGDGTIPFYAGYNEAENPYENPTVNVADKQAVINWYKKEFAHWSNMFLQLFEQADHFIIRPQYYMPPGQAWETLPNLTLLGDAAHVMPPYAGEGVNMAMLDALQLSECLLNPSTPDTYAALTAYEKQMHHRMTTVINDTLEMTNIFHSPEAAEKILAFFNQPH